MGDDHDNARKTVGWGTAAGATARLAGALMSTVSVAKVTADQCSSCEPRKVTCPVIVGHGAVLSRTSGLSPNGYGASPPKAAAWGPLPVVDVRAGEGCARRLCRPGASGSRRVCRPGWRRRLYTTARTTGRAKSTGPPA